MRAIKKIIRTNMQEVTREVLMVLATEEERQMFERKPKQKKEKRSKS